ncbi:MAG TPA: type II toxin-antitoxin system Phd/YefM family antitoxin [Terriglobales bacterium]|nr:type II toxin-antitoxin system Phd/YefM family antitoxin [Terriglobales bacterium]
MKEMAAGEFKAKCLRVMDQVQKTREPVLITKRGKPVAQLVPAPGSPEDIFDYMKGKVTIPDNVDVVSPVIPEDEWEMLK